MLEAPKQLQSRLEDLVKEPDDSLTTDSGLLTS